MSEPGAAIRSGLLAAGWGCVGLIAVLSLLPGDEMVRTSLGGHVEHAMAYAGTALLLSFGSPARKTWWIMAGLVAYAGLLEVLQNFSPGRHPAVEDWVASSTGVLVGCAAARLLDGLVRRWTAVPE
jgi:VanZ family protein